MVEIHKRVGRPQSGAQFLAGDDLPGLFQHSQQDLERLVLQLYPGALAPKFTTSGIQLKNAETNETIWLRLLHRGISRALGGNIL
jgi:hypothetical protein